VAKRRAMTRRKRRGADWVYRQGYNLIGTRGTGLGADLIGTYDPSVTTVSTGQANAQSRILYDANDYFADLTRGGVGSAGTLASQAVATRAGRSEGRKPCMRAVEGYIYCEPSTWAIGNVMALGVRLGVFEQDIGSGVITIDSAYSMWAYTATLQDPGPAHWANSSRMNCKEWRIWNAFSQNSPLVVMRIRWRGRKFLNANECFALYLEAPTTSINVRTQYWLRTLVEDED